jgi:hypothetical protein
MHDTSNATAALAGPAASISCCAIALYTALMTCTSPAVVVHAVIFSANTGLLVKRSTRTLK